MKDRGIRTDMLECGTGFGTFFGSKDYIKLEDSGVMSVGRLTSAHTTVINCGYNGFVSSVRRKPILRTRIGHSNLSRNGRRKHTRAGSGTRSAVDAINAQLQPGGPCTRNSRLSGSRSSIINAAKTIKCHVEDLESTMRREGKEIGTFDRLGNASARIQCDNFENGLARGTGRATARFSPLVISTRHNELMRDRKSGL